MSTPISLWNEPRPGKRLLVLDIDRTLADFDDPIIPKTENVRAYLQSFLTSVYKYYDIIIWSGTAVNFVLIKLVYMKVLTSKDYKILSVLDETHMVPVFSAAYGEFVMVKPLSIIWKLLPQYNKKNTLIIDDQSKNFFFNPRNGLEIKPYLQQNYVVDHELLFLTDYLICLALTSTNFCNEDLKHWREYL